MNIMKILFLLVFINVCVRNNFSNATYQKHLFKHQRTVYDFTVKDLYGSNIPMSLFKGNVMLIVNVASKCPLMEHNYKELNYLQEKYASRGLVVLAFPCDQFMSQEPGGNSEICRFNKSKKTKFRVFAKVKINGEDASPLWKFLKSQRFFLSVKQNFIWNYTKFIVDRYGKVVQRISTFDVMKTEKYLKPYFFRKRMYIGKIPK